MILNGFQKKISIHRDRDRDRDIYAAGTTPIRFHDHDHGTKNSRSRAKNETFTVNDFKRFLKLLNVFHNIELGFSSINFREIKGFIV